jgi:carnitine 3-dehydrogenase
MIDRAMAFYAAIGKKPIRLRRELKGHIANRLQAALWRELFHLVDIGAATVADIEVAIAHGPGLRWARSVHLHICIFQAETAASLISSPISADR